MRKLVVSGVICMVVSPLLFAQNLKPIKNTLIITNAATICERILTNLQSKHNFATEEITKSTDSELAVTWPPNEGKAPVICKVNRITEKITAIETNGSVITESEISEMERDAKFRGEIKSGNYKNFTKFAKEAITRSLKDPESVQFRGLFLSGKVLPVLCGEINGKNSYGAYIGFHRFYATGQDMLNKIESEQYQSVFESTWSSMCGEKIADIVESIKK